MKNNNGKEVCGIYKIQNKHGDVYIGSSNKIYKRWSNHLAKLRAGSYTYPQFQNSWNEDNNNLTFEIIQVLASDTNNNILSMLEKWYIDYYNDVDCKNVINKQQDKTTRRNPSENTDNFKKAQTGERNGNAKYSRELIVSVKEKIRDGVKPIDISEETGISIHYIYSIKNGRKWSSVTIFSEDNGNAGA